MVYGTLSYLGKQLRNGSVSSVDLIKHSLNALEKTKHLNAFITVDNNQSLLDQAQLSDKQQQQSTSTSRRPLEGIPIAVKDNFSTTGLKTTCASNILANYTPSFDATVVSLLKQAGAIIIGKTNMDEFAMGSSTTNGHSGASINPWSTTTTAPLVAGGSSGGSAVAVSSRVVPCAIGSDTGGSVRQPAAYCGVVGFKPSYGSISRYGLVAYASSFDTPGFFVHSADDAALLLDVLVRRDPRDSTSIKHPTEGGFAKHLEKTRTSGFAGLRFGIPTDYLVSEMDPEIIALWRQTAELIESNGGQVVPVELPNTRHALPAYYILATSEASSNLSRYDGIRYGGGSGNNSEQHETAQTLKQQYIDTRSAGFGPEATRRILLGTMSLSRGSYDNYYTKAQQIRRLVSDDFKRAFEEQHVDVLITPTTPSGSFALNQDLDPINMYINDIMTIPANMAGLPSASIPLKLSSKGTPLSLQLIGNHQCDHQVLEAVAKVMEMSAFQGFSKHTPHLIKELGL
ncbi:hypothetical protein SAMD00019534_112020 [Acytostelium subglobosum LB1]|uniref:hypothetical protein n=1 Tax=Acytostelium subglobosum LB1 TaxID=1410327 RepID=UPI000645182F|nr:hypothetical protein SAMD00019534_112020 [Acytostelium subglobosum LB1]GAM28026.1 hypothetical protein SAMD00019534_112020 [Acytostelium subglobosum LB1]|eukprot:XP_012748985.1 hypothetical protein SAMD00019534_112020 [Acytostelium subglobosum LB1]